MSSNVASVYDNGGMIGATLNLGSTEQYITGSTTGTPSIVGTASANGASSVSLTGIAGLAEGDLVVVFASEDNSTAPAVITSTGWTILVNGAFTNSIEHSIAYKVMGATVDTSISIQTTIDAITVIALRDVQYTDISTVASSLGTTINPPAVTATDNDSVVLVLSALDDDSSTISSPPTGYTTAVQDGRLGGSNAIMYKTGVSAGTEDPATVTWASSDSSIAYTLVFSPTSSVTYGNYKNSGIWSLDSFYEFEKSKEINYEFLYLFGTGNNGTGVGTGTGQSLGTEAPNRVIFIGLSSSSSTASAVYVGADDLPATLVPNSTQTTGLITTEWWYCAVPTGTTGRVFISYSGTSAHTMVAVYAVYGDSISVQDVATSGNLLNGTLDVDTSNNSLVLACAEMQSSNTISWSGLTEDDEISVTDTVNLQFASASAKTSVTETRGITVTMDGTARAASAISIKNY